MSGWRKLAQQLPECSGVVALEGSKAGWLDYEATLAAAPSHFVRPDIR
ncbi:MAG: hypothetical protein AAB676_10005 [Verrucomicrobiota bacterium]